MKQDQLNQHIKHALESIEPEVPAHLWNNIKAGLSTGAPASSGAEGAHATGSTSGSMSSLATFKIGAAAIALLGGGLLVWYLTTEAPQESTAIVQQSEQSSTPELKGSANKGSNASGESTKPIEFEEAQESESNNERMVHSSVDEPKNDAVVNSAEVRIGENAHEKTAQSIEHDPKEEVIEGPVSVTMQDDNVEDSQVITGDRVNELEATSQAETVVDEIENEASSYATDVAIPLEAGILADKVSGEAPLTVNFSNVASAYSFEWDFDNGRRSIEQNPVITFTEPGDYTVRLVVRDEKGNRVNDQMEITVFDVSKIFVPDVITPNGDGVNDEFKVIGYNVNQIRFSIYRLDGTQVFESRGANDAWDGIDVQNPQADKYVVEAIAVKTNGEPIQKRQMLHVLRE